MGFSFQSLKTIKGEQHIDPFNKNARDGVIGTTQYINTHNFIKYKKMQ